MSATVEQQCRFLFNKSGVVVKMVSFDRAILKFRLGHREEYAVLLSRALTVDSRQLDNGSNLSEHLKVDDAVVFDCHVYDRGGQIGSGKDRCNYFVTRAAKKSGHYCEGTGIANIVSAANVAQGIGWVSELGARRGVLTFEHANSREERVVFHASRVWLFEKCPSTKQSLTDILSEGDTLNFEAVAKTGGEDDPDFSYCPWLALTVWKGKRPSDDAISLREEQWKHADMEKELIESSGDEKNYVINGRVYDSLIRGVGVMGKIVNDKAGIIWWLKAPNHLQSVWFEARRTFLYGVNLADKSLLDIFKEGDPVSFLAVKSPEDHPTKWMARQVLIDQSTANIVLMTVDRKNVANTAFTPEESPS